MVRQSRNILVQASFKTCLLRFELLHGITNSRWKRGCLPINCLRLAFSVLCSFALAGLVRNTPAVDEIKDGIVLVDEYVVVSQGLTVGYVVYYSLGQERVCGGVTRGTFVSDLVFAVYRSVS